MRVRAFLPALAVLPAASLVSGGWAVITIENAPESLTVDVPYALEYTVRQHGVELLNGLNGVVEAKNGGRTVRADAAPAASKGKYKATLSIPTAGEWTITVNSGFIGKSMTTLKPISVVAPGATVAAMTDVERGERLFVSKGCVTCHVDIKAIPTDIRTTKYDEKFVRQLLADPKSMPRRYNAGVEMPNLGLKQAEISALAAYLAGPNSTGTR